MTVIGDIAALFEAHFSGEVITPSDGRYDAAREVWNAIVQGRPAVIARCHTVADIVSAVALCRDAAVYPAIRAGGHSVAGLSTGDGVVIDLTAMRRVDVDPAARRARVQPGATWHDLDAAGESHGLATTGGLISTTGVAGLTLGGGIGWLQRRYGLACDNLVAADVVTAAGDVVHADADENANLLWALRGGGGNFGVVASLEFALHPVATVYSGLMLWPFDRARDVLREFRGWADDLADDGSMLVSIMTAPPEPFVPADLVGQRAIGLIGCWCGDLDAGAAAVQPMRDLGPAVDLFGPMPYPALQSMLDAGAPFGLRNYFRTGFLDRLDDAVIDVLIEHGATLPSPMSQIHLHQMGGAVTRGESAFANRNAAFTYNLISTWIDRTDDDVHVSANSAMAAALAPLSAGRAYINFLASNDTDAVRSAYGSDIYSRLVDVKRDFDPNNMFRINQNVPPR
jgi:FAD/FMN-containing dehydrogenase